MDYITKQATRARNKPGGAGSDMGPIAKGFPFSCKGWIVDGWINYIDGTPRWIPYSVVELVTAPPPPDEDPDDPEDPPVPAGAPDQLLARWITGIDANGNKTWTEHIVYNKEAA
jgi:hypothetical protein